MSETVTEGIARQLKIDASKLEESLKSEESVLYESLGSPVTHTFTESGHAELIKNTDHIGYEKGKVAGVEMNFKKFIEPHEDNEILSQTKSYDEFFEKLKEINDSSTSKQLEQLKVDLGGNVDERIKEWQGKAEGFQTQLGSLQSAFEAQGEKHKNELAAKDESIVQKEADTITWNSANLIEFQVDSITDEKELESYVKVQRENLVNLFKLKNSVEFEDSVTVVRDRATGDIIRNETQSPVSVTDVMKKFAKENFFQVAKEARHGKGGGNKPMLNIEIKAIKTKEDFQEYCDKKGIPSNSNEMVAVLNEVKNHNPAFKL